MSAPTEKSPGTGSPAPEREKSGANVVLIGFMCSGKSKVGKELASRLGWTFHDTDEMIEKAARSRVGDIIRRQGEDVFRQLERDAVQHVAAFEKAIIATGGGVPLNPANMADLQKNGRLVWLQVLPRTVLRRAGDFSTRPLIDPSDPLGSVQKRMAEREELYAAAELRIDTNTVPVTDVADRILAHWKDLKK